MFGKGDAVSVALELEYEASFPKLWVVPEPLPHRPSRRVQRRRVILGLVVLGLLVLLALPIRAIGGHPVTGSAPAAGQVYVVQGGDTLASIARRVETGSGAGNVAGLVRRLSAEVGSSTVVPGEHLLIP
jgi:hypothetical protein